jgi:putative tricarboxylic transport membrane protein
MNPSWLLVPGILCISYIGVYAINTGTFDLTMAAFLGLIGYLLRKGGVHRARPSAPSSSPPTTD